MANLNKRVGNIIWAVIIEAVVLVTFIIIESGERVDTADKLERITYQTREVDFDMIKSYQTITSIDLENLKNSIMPAAFKGRVAPAINHD